MKKTFLKVLVISVLAIAALGFLKDGLAKVVVEGVCKTVTGLKLNIKSLHLGLLDTQIHVNSLRLFNPKSFKDKIMLDLPEVYVDYNLPSIIKGEPRLEELRLNLKEFVIIKNADGVMNLDALKPKGAGEKKEAAKKAKEEKADTPEKKESKKASVIQIDKLVLDIGTVIYKDYSKGGEPSIKEYKINIHETYTNVKDIRGLLPLVVTKALMNTTIASLAGINPAELLSDLKIGGMDLNSLGLGKVSDLAVNLTSEAGGIAAKTTEQATAIMSEAGEKAGSALSGLVSALGGSGNSQGETEVGQAAESVTNAVNEAVGSLKNIFSSES